MTTQTTLNVGDIINIKNDPTDLLVVWSELLVRKDDRSDVSFSVYEFDCVKIPLDKKGKIIDCVTFEPKDVQKYYLEGGSMGGEGQALKYSDVQVVGTSTTQISVTHAIKKIKYY